MPYVFVGKEHWGPLLSYLEYATRAQLVQDWVMRDVFFVDSLLEATDIYREWLVNGQTWRKASTLAGARGPDADEEQDT